MSEPVERTTPSDADLLAAHVAGDPSAFGTLVTRHRDRLWAVALRTCGDPDMAADGLQDAVVAAFRRAEGFRGEAAVTTWLHRIVVNACLDRLRAARVRRADPLPDDAAELDRLLHGAEQGGPLASTPPTDPAEAAERTERRARVLAALATLTPEQRAAVVLVDMEGYSVAEAADVLDCAEGTIKSRCSRARARLAVVLADVLDHAEHASAAPGAVVGSGATAGNPTLRPDVGPLARRGPPTEPLVD